MKIFFFNLNKKNDQTYNKKKKCFNQIIINLNEIQQKKPTSEMYFLFQSDFQQYNLTYLNIWSFGKQNKM